MPNIVQQNSYRSSLKLLVRNRYAFVSQHFQRLLHQVQRAKCVVKPSVQRARIHIMRHSELLDSAHSLHPAMVNQVEQNALRNADEPIHRVIEYLFFEYFQNAIFLVLTMQPVIWCIILKNSSFRRKIDYLNKISLLLGFEKMKKNEKTFDFSDQR